MTIELPVGAVPFDTALGNSTRFRPSTPWKLFPNDETILKPTDLYQKGGLVA
jgi:hypothetical protein